MEVKKMLFCALFLALLIFASCANADDAKKVYLNAFIETSTAYLNDAFVLVGAISDSFMTESTPTEAATATITNLQRRLRIVRAKIKGILLTRVGLTERKLLSLLDSSYACLDQQTWSLLTFFKENTPASAKRFEGLRIECLEKVQAVSTFYTSLPPAPELPEPLSTR